MHDPDSYDAYSEFQRRDARELVPHLVSKMSWTKTNNIILDVGCGSGYNTRNVLLPELEKTDTNAFTYAVDVSKKMIDFASVKYCHPNVTYLVADIAKEDCEFPCKFDKIFSFHVLHWILDQEKVLSQLFQMLNNNGEIGMYYLANATVFTVYDNMSKNPKWSSYLSDASNFIPKSYFTKDPANDMHQMMSSIGYFVQEARTYTRSFEFSSIDAMIDAAMAANPFLHRIPVEKQDEYREDFRSCFIPLVHSAPNGNGGTSPSSVVQVDYEIALIRALKI